MKWLTTLGVLAVLTSYIVTPAIAQSSSQNWPQWRGPTMDGVAQAEPPLKWSETENVKWKVKIPGFGSSTPIIWGNQVFISTAVPSGKKAAEKKTASDQPAENRGDREGRRRSGGGGGGFGAEPAPDESYQFTLISYDRTTGKVLWQHVAREETPHEGHHKDHGFASASPMTDGKHVLAYFGSRGLYCYDMKGNLKWEKDFGDMQTRNGFGEGSSAALHGNTVVVLWDHEGDDFIVALDKNTGKELWKQKRDEPTNWTTPLVVEHNGKPQVIINGTNKIRSYDLQTGKLIWECAGQTLNAIPTPVADEDTVYVTSGFRGNALQAIALGRTGDLTDTDAVRWSHNKSTPYVPSPLLVDDLLYIVAGNNGVLSCFDKKTGKIHFEHERLEGLYGIYASPVAAKDRIYVLGREGTCVVLKKGPELEIIATNKLDDKTDASFAMVGKEIFVRGHQYLYCIAEK
ncbi:MAG: PQQ-like beta-propeller repeat protein [Verrucomicrobia bacterium]|nr:PQQ-like beta-propeller repeat protein [Verrucomicrobiota bacterium]